MDNQDANRTEPSIGATQTNTNVSYIYQFRKEELIQLAESYGLLPSGSVDDLRRRIVRYVRGESGAPTVTQESNSSASTNSESSQILTPTAPIDPPPVNTTAQVVASSLGLNLGQIVSQTPHPTTSTLLDLGSLVAPRTSYISPVCSTHPVPIPTRSLTTPTTVTITVTSTPTYTAPRILRSLFTGLVNAQPSSIPAALPTSTVVPLPITTIHPPVTRPDYSVTISTTTPLTMPPYVPTSWTVPTTDLPTTAVYLPQQQHTYTPTTLPYLPAPTMTYPPAPTMPHQPVPTMPYPPAYPAAVNPTPPQQYTQFPYTVPPATPAMGSPLQISKWGIHFDGRNDPASFLERLEEICLSQNINMDLILPYLPDILRGDAALWYRNNRHTWQTWTDFRTAFRVFYFPVNYEIDLEVAISRRLQKPGEPTSQYITDLQTLIRRHGHISPAQELQWLYRNLLPEFRQQIRRNEFHDVLSFSMAVRDYELLNKEIQDTRRFRNCHQPSVDQTPSHNPIPPPVRQFIQPPADQPPRPPLLPRQSRMPPGENQGHRAPPPNNEATPRQPPRRSTAPARSLTCWRCGRSGHVRTECRYPARLFCSRCGKEGILSRDCPCRGQGN